MSQAGTIDIEKANPTIATSYTSDSGTAVPILNNLEILGGLGNTTSASGKTLTIDSVLTLSGNSGGAINFSSDNWNVVGDGSVTTSGLGSTLTVKLQGLDQFSLLVGANTTTIGKIAAIPQSGIPLVSKGNGANPAYDIAQVIGGGTGLATLLANSLYVGNAASPPTAVGVGANGTLLQGSGAIPAWTTATYPATTTINQILYSSAANTVTGLATANSAVLVTGATGIPSLLGSMTDGQFLIGSTGAIPVLAALTQGAGVTITNGAGSVTISATGVTWNTVTAASQTMAVGNGYISNRAGLITYLLPATAIVGDVLAVTGINTAAGWIITQNANQQIFFGTGQTTLGATGSLSSTNIRDTVYLECVVAGASTVWNVTDGVGNIAIDGTTTTINVCNLATGALGTTLIGQGASVTPVFSATLLLSSSSLAPLNLVSTDAGATAGPIIDIYRNSASPAASDIIGQLTFSGASSTAVKRTYASIQANITDPVNATEDATITSTVMIAGTGTIVSTLTGTGFNSTAIGATTPSTGSFTTINNNTSAGSALTAATVTTPSATITGGTIDNTIIGGSTAVAGTFTAVTLVSAAALTSLTMSTTDGGATAGPIIDIYRNSASPAASDIIGQLTFSGASSTAVKRVYASIQANITDPVNATEDATITSSVMVAGTPTVVSTLTGTGINSTAIGATTVSTGAFSTVSATGVITSTLATGTAPFTIASTTNVANLNASSLGGATFAAPGAIGGGTPGAATFTTLTAVGTTNINATGAATTSIGTGGTGVVNIGNATGNTAVTGTLTASANITASTGGVTATAGDVTVTSGNLVLSAGTATITGGATLTTITTSTTDGGATAGPIFDAYRNSASPAAADILAQKLYSGNSSTGVKRNYASIEGNIVTATNASEDGSITFGTMSAGTLATRATIDKTSVRYGNNSLGYDLNLAISYASNTLTIQGRSAALSATNPACIWIQDNSTPGLGKLYTVTANQTFIDSTGASQIIGNLLGMTTGVAVTADIPIYVYACTDGTSITFGLSRVPHMAVAPVVANIGSSASATADTQGSLFLLANVTRANYAGLPVLLVGSFRMRMNTSDDWAVQALSTSDGVGQFQEGVIFTTPSGQFGANSGTYCLPNGGTAPVWTTNNSGYHINRSGRVHLEMYMNGDGGTDGSGAVNSTVAIPFIASNDTATGGTTLGYGLQIQAAGTQTFSYLNISPNANTVALGLAGVVTTWGAYTNGNRRAWFQMDYVASLSV